MELIRSNRLYMCGVRSTRAAPRRISDLLTIFNLTKINIKVVRLVQSSVASSTQIKNSPEERNSKQTKKRRRHFCGSRVEAGRSGLRITKKERLISALLLLYWQSRLIRLLLLLDQQREKERCQGLCKAEEEVAVAETVLEEAMVEVINEASKATTTNRQRTN